MATNSDTNLRDNNIHQQQLHQILESHINEHIGQSRNIDNPSSNIKCSRRNMETATKEIPYRSVGTSCSNTDTAANDYLRKENIFNIAACQKSLQQQPILESEICVATVSKIIPRDKNISQQHPPLEFNVNELNVQSRDIDNPCPNSKWSGSKQNTQVDAAGNSWTTTKASTVDWVQEIFVTTKETLNVPLNHSCQEIPSQTFDISPKSTGTPRFHKQMMGDEFEVSKLMSYTNSSIRVDNQECNAHTAQASNIHNSSLYTNIAPGRIS